MQEPTRSDAHDDFLWLEDIYGEEPSAWVAAQNARTAAMLDSPSFSATQDQILSVLDSSDRIPTVSRHGEFFYNFWRDAEHPRGIWRRTTLASYRTDSPDWDVLLDVDALGREEDQEWVFAGADIRYPDRDRALIRLSPDGGDAVTIREFDLPSREFVKDGFVVPTAKSGATWIDADTIFVTSDFGPGTLTTSSYPRQVKCWTRGTPLSETGLVYEIPADHMIVGVDHDHTPGFERDVLVDVVDFFHRRTYLLVDGDLVAIDVPDDAAVDLWREWLLIHPRSDWQIGDAIYPTGSLLAIRLDAFLDGSRAVTALFTPDSQTSLDGWSGLRNHLLLTLLHDVTTRVDVLTPGEDGTWSSQPLAGAPDLHTVSVAGVDPDESDDYWLSVAGFLTPSSLQIGTIGNDEVELLKSSPSFFDASKFTVEQHFASSLDGTRVPYFQIGLKDLVLDGSNLTLLYGYGGFEISLKPSYSGSIGRSWLERGGVYVIANIRGGGEYGPAWHTAALHENRHRAYEDFSAVARGLVDRRVTSPAHLGCEGGSNGGLLVGNMLTTYPELFGAIVCEVPLLDMRRYTKLSAGFSWIAEYGDPDDPAQWEYVRTFSPYHNLRDDVTYPPVLFYTATSDDRVGPVQARKMAARMLAMDIPDVWFYENREGGHGAAADNKQSAHLHAAAYEFLWRHLSAAE